MLKGRQFTTLLDEILIFTVFFFGFYIKIEDDCDIQLVIIQIWYGASEYHGKGCENPNILFIWERRDVNVIIAADLFILWRNFI